MSVFRKFKNFISGYGWNDTDWNSYSAWEKPATVEESKGHYNWPSDSDAKNVYEVTEAPDTFTRGYRADHLVDITPVSKAVEKMKNVKVTSEDINKAVKAVKKTPKKKEVKKNNGNKARLDKSR